MGIKERRVAERCRELMLLEIRGYGRTGKYLTAVTWKASPTHNTAATASIKIPKLVTKESGANENYPSIVSLLLQHRLMSSGKKMTRGSCIFCREFIPKG